MSKSIVKCTICLKEMRADTLARHSKTHATAAPSAPSTVINTVSMEALDDLLTAASLKEADVDKRRIKEAAERAAEKERQRAEIAEAFRTKAIRFTKELFLKEYYEEQRKAARWIHNMTYGTPDCTPKCATRAQPCSPFSVGTMDMYSESTIEGMYRSWLSTKR